MSADNWAICPRCKQIAQEEQIELERTVVDAYGKVPPEKYLELLAKSQEGIKLDATLREDYELGILEDGFFYVRYSGHCRDCGLEFKYIYDEVVTKKDK